MHTLHTSYQQLLKTTTAIAHDYNQPMHQACVPTTKNTLHKCRQIILRMREVITSDERVTLLRSVEKDSLKARSPKQGGWLR